ncbi:MAG: winged helix-turn-helix transcriptional regulator [Acidimicrobiales bacterium]
MVSASQANDRPSDHSESHLDPDRPDKLHLRQSGSGHPLALDEAVSRVGDRWSLLVINALLDGPRRFNELLDSIPGLAPNVLSHRLKRLEQDHVIVATPYSKRPPRFSYALTAEGRDLGGALRLLANWGAARIPEAEPLVHATCGTPVEVRWYCPTCHRVVEFDEATDLRFL